MKTRENANSSVWWPGLSKDIEKTVKNCVVCEKYRRERVRPMKGTKFPERPWSRVGADFFFHKASTYLLMIDYYSRDVKICQVTRKVDTGETISKMQKAKAFRTFSSVTMVHSSPRVNLNSLRKTMDLSILHHPQDIHNPMERQNVLFRP